MFSVWSRSLRAAVPRSARLGVPWPLPALAAWALAWAVFRGSAAAGAPAWLALLLGTATGLGSSLLAASRLRAAVVAAGFPLSLGAGGAAALPAWAWLLPLALLLALYPCRAWRDAPLFPTPHGALDALALELPLPPGARVLDAGCGLGHGLRALRRAYPHARLDGIEWSWPLALLARAACPQATVRHGDLWAQRWSGYDLVYLFQRPESMPRALAKAEAEMRRGAWLASLEFEAAGRQPQQVLRCADGRPLWLYRLPLRRVSASGASGASSASSAPGPGPISSR
ncbi:MAG TPA: class I SAM-dependent methyltransferase [Rubrivivax sp.]|nr:class I SAM-dependent methyltransferase [Rubrivivax sp.]